MNRVYYIKGFLEEKDNFITRVYHFDTLSDLHINDFENSEYLDPDEVIPQIIGSNDYELIRLQKFPTIEELLAMEKRNELGI